MRYNWQVMPRGTERTSQTWTVCSDFRGSTLCNARQTAQPQRMRYQRIEYYRTKLHCDHRLHAAHLDQRVHAQLNLLLRKPEWHTPEVLSLAYDQSLIHTLREDRSVEDIRCFYYEQTR